MTGSTWAATAALGGLGAVGRFVVDSAISGWLRREVPLGTLAVNLSGSVALGALTASVSGTALALAGTAAVGSYTTFSTWMLESHRLAEEGEQRRAWINLVGSLALGLGAAALGRAVARHL